MAGGLGRMCLGASGGICGLNGLRFGMLRRMENAVEGRVVMKDMVVLMLLGAVVDGVSNAAHVGGFVCGMVMATLFGPTFGYSANAKRTVIADEVPVEYRRVIGGGKMPGRGMFPLKYVWLGVGLVAAYRPVLRSIPAAVLTGIQRPGVLSGMVTSVI